MGFYLRKSVSVGPLRFNLSKSGIGVSAGVRGLRLGSGPRGNYVHMGRHGIYYRATLPSGPTAAKSARPSASRPIQPQPSPASVETLAPIESANVAEMVDSSAVELLTELNEKYKRPRMWPWVCGFFVLGLWPLSGAPDSGVGGGAVILAYLVAGAVATFMIHRYDTLRRTTVLLYELENEAGTRYQAFHNAFNELLKCRGSWHVQARGATTDRKHNGRRRPADAPECYYARHQITQYYPDEHCRARRAGWSGEAIFLSGSLARVFT